MALLNRRPRSGGEMEQEHDKKKAAESFAGIQGQGGDRRLERRQDASRVRAAIRCASEPDCRRKTSPHEIRVIHRAGCLRSERAFGTFTVEFSCSARALLVNGLRR